ncbi:MAG: TRAP transporter small permease subunit [Pseudomonadota bacterium]
MPSLTFVLPHWLYWAGLIVFPLIAMVLASRAHARSPLGRTSLGIAYLALLTAGFIGVHRFYVRSVWGTVFILPFLGILYANIESSGARETLSLARSEIVAAEFKVETFQAQVEQGRSGAETRLAEAQADLEAATGAIDQAETTFTTWSKVARWLAMLLAAMILVDAILLPWLVRRARAKDPPAPERANDTAIPENDPANNAPRSTIVRSIETLSDKSGEFVAFWSVLAVFAYYYEVLARYLFNSPTNWVHEGMFLMFGMQYLISGAYAYLSDSHVRVDVFYARLSRRGKALSDLLTSVFFFIFAGTLLGTGWIFMMDSVRVGEVSFTEWGIPYWPVKIAITLGAALLILQGFAKVLKDLAILRDETV